MPRVCPARLQCTYPALYQQAAPQLQVLQQAGCLPAWWRVVVLLAGMPLPLLHVEAVHMAPYAAAGSVTARSTTISVCMGNKVTTNRQGHALDAVCYMFVQCITSLGY